MWVARDKDGSLHLWSVKPIRYINKKYKYYNWCTSFDKETSCYRTLLCRLYDALFPELQWKDEPIEVTLLPKPTIETIRTNPIYNAIYCMGINDAMKKETNYNIHSLDSFIEKRWND